MHVVQGDRTANGGACPSQQPAGLSRHGSILLSLEQGDGLADGRGRFLEPTGQTEDLGEIEQCVRVIVEAISVGHQLESMPGETLCLLCLGAPGQHAGERSAPAHLGVDVARVRKLLGASG